MYLDYENYIKEGYEISYNNKRQLLHEFVDYLYDNSNLKELTNLFNLMRLKNKSKRLDDKSKMNQYKQDINSKIDSIGYDNLDYIYYSLLKHNKLFKKTKRDIKIIF